MTPQEALRRAFWTVRVPSMTLLLGPLLSLMAGIQMGVIPDSGPVAMRWAIPTLVLSFVGGWLVWSIQIPKWRLWAYERVENIPLLKAMAAGSQLIWPEGSIFEKSEIASSATWAKIRALEGSGR